MVREQYEIHWRDYYEILQVHPCAEPEVIAVAYRKLAQLYHPDLNKDLGATDRLKLINEAYEVLGDPTRRARYDDFYAAKSQPSDDGRGTADQPSSYAWAEERAESWGRQGWEYPDGEPWDDPAESMDGWGWAESDEDGSTGTWANVRAWIAPKPHETERIMPWPSWKSQRALLVAAIPMALLLLSVAAAQAAAAGIAMAVVLLGISIYAGVATGWLRHTRQAPLLARVAGGVSITVSGIAVGLAVLYIVVGVALFVLTLFAIGALVRAMLEEGLKSR